MEQLKNLLEMLSQRIDRLASGNAVVAKTISVGDRHIIPLCELSIGLGGGGGVGEGEGVSTDAGPVSGKGKGGGAGGGGKASPVAVVVIDKGKVRLAKIED